MKGSKVVMVVHPNAGMRILLRTMLQEQGRTVLTGDSWLDLISDRAGASPDVILLDRSLLNPEKTDILTALRRKWIHAELVFLPEGLGQAATQRDNMIQVLRNTDRILAMKTTQELLAVSQNSG